MHEKFALSGDTKIQYLSVNQMPGSDPVVFIPGAVVNAEEFFEPIKDHVNFYCIIISLRGLGKSSKPMSGYSLDHFISDIDSVTKAEGLKNFWIAGHSVGAGIASGYAVKYPEKVKGLILADYPPGYPKFTPEWGKMVKENHPDTDDNFVNGVITESEKRFFPEELVNAKVKLLVLKGDGEDSLLPTELAERVLDKIPGSSLKVIKGCGHEMFHEKPAEVLSIIEDFTK